MKVQRKYSRPCSNTASPSFFPSLPFILPFLWWNDVQRVHSVMYMTFQKICQFCCLFLIQVYNQRSMTIVSDKIEENHTKYRNQVIMSQTHGIPDYFEVGYKVLHMKMCLSISWWSSFPFLPQIKLSGMDSRSILNSLSRNDFSWMKNELSEH